MFEHLYLLIPKRIVAYTLSNEYVRVEINVYLTCYFAFLRRLIFHRMALDKVLPPRQISDVRFTKPRLFHLISNRR